MALTQAYVNEVLNHLPSTVVVDEQTWPELVRLLKFEGRDLTTLIIGQMALRQARGGYAGLQADLSALLKENEDLRDQLQQAYTRAEDFRQRMHAWRQEAEAFCPEDLKQKWPMSERIEAINARVEAATVVAGHD